MSERRREFEIFASGSGTEEEEVCDVDAAVDADDADDADDVVQCRCSELDAACAISARAAAARKKSTAMASRQLTSAICRRRMVKESPLFLSLSVDLISN